MTGSPPLDRDELDDATSVLLVAPEVGQPVASRLSDLLCSLETTPERVVGVTTSKSPRDFLDPWRRSFPTETSFSFVSTNGVSRSVAACGGGSGSTDIDVTHVDDVTPLSVLGRTIADQVGDEDGETAVCFHSLTDLLEYVDTRTAFRFLHVLLSRVRRNGAFGVYHIDGDVHDRETIVQLSTLFDLVVEFDRTDVDRDGATGESR